MLNYANVVGNQEDWANYITNVDMRETPFLDWLPVGGKPVNVLHQYQADKFANPRQNSHVDGQDWQAFNSAADGRGVLKSLIQWFDNTTSVSKLSEDVSNAAGVADELARDIPKRLKEMARDMEVQFLGDTDCREGTTTQGYLTRGVGSWTSTSAQTTYPVPSDFRPTSDTVNATAYGSLTEKIMQDILEGIGSVTGQNQTTTVWCGPKLKRAFSGFTFLLPTSTSSQASGSVFNQDAKSKKITRVVDTYEGDFGTLELRPSWFIGTMTSAGTVTTYAAAPHLGYRGYFLHQKMWELRWNQKPTVYKPEFKGGSYKAAMDAICMLVCKSPLGEGKYAPTA